MLENNSCWNGLFVRNMRYEQKVTLIPVCRSLFRYVLHNALCGYCIHYMVSATKPSFIFIKFGAWINFFLKVQIKFPVLRHILSDFDKIWNTSVHGKLLSDCKFHKDQHNDSCT